MHSDQSCNELAGTESQLEWSSEDTSPPGTAFYKLVAGRITNSVKNVRVESGSMAARSFLIRTTSHSPLCIAAVTWLHPLAVLKSGCHSGVKGYMKTGVKGLSTPPDDEARLRMSLKTRCCGRKHVLATIGPLLSRVSTPPCTSLGPRQYNCQQGWRLDEWLLRKVKSTNTRKYNHTHAQAPCRAPLKHI